MCNSFPFSAMHIPFEPLFLQKVAPDDPAGLYLAFQDDAILVHADHRFLSYDALGQFRVTLAEPVLLIGQYEDGTCIYVAQLLDYDKSSTLKQASLRLILPDSSARESLAMMRGRELLYFLGEHKFCGRCGQLNQLKDHEPCMMCSGCQDLHFPIINPAVLVLVEKGDQILLARNIRFPEGLYSLVAGFCEPGEVAEDTAIREVFEETGIVVGDVRFMLSQNWPYPHSLMLGFRAQWISGDIACDMQEIVDAHWFGIDNLPILPNQGSLARTMINIWAAEHGVALHEDLHFHNDQL